MADSPIITKIKTGTKRGRLTYETTEKEIEEDLKRLKPNRIDELSGYTTPKNNTTSYRKNNTTKMDKDILDELRESIISSIRKGAEEDKIEVRKGAEKDKIEVVTTITDVEARVTERVDIIQKEVSEMKEKQTRQEQDTKILGENQTKIIKRLDDLEQGDRTKYNSRGEKTSPWHEHLREQVSLTFKKIAIFGLPDDKDTIYIRNQANDMKLSQEMKDEMKNNPIHFITDKRTTRGTKTTNSRLYHMTTSGLTARSAILMAAKHRPGGLRFDKVIPHPFKIGYNKQKALIWIIRSAIIMSAQLEIHGHTSIIFIKEKENSTRRIFSEFTPAEKNIKTILNANNMETNVDNKDEDKPTIAYHENKAICDNLSSIIIITGFEIVLEDEHKMLEIKTLLSPEDYPKIIESSHTKYQTRITFESKVIALEIYNKYTADPKKPKKWEWSTFQQEDFKMI